MRYFVTYQVSSSAWQGMANYVVVAPESLTMQVVNAMEKFLSEHVERHRNVFGEDANVVLVNVLPLAEDSGAQEHPVIADGFD